MQTKLRYTGTKIINTKQGRTPFELYRISSDGKTRHKLGKYATLEEAIAAEQEVKLDIAVRVKKYVNITAKQKYLTE